MGNPTIVYFYREDVMLTKRIELASSSARIHLYLPFIINACIEQAQYYAAQNQRESAGNILYNATELLLPDSSNHNVDNFDELAIYGVQRIVEFVNLGFWDVVEKVLPKLPDPSQLRWDLDGAARSSYPRLPTLIETPFRLLLKKIARPGMFFMEREELTGFLEVSQSIIEKSELALEWKILRDSHETAIYDLALFYTFV